MGILIGPSTLVIVGMTFPLLPLLTKYFVINVWLHKNKKDVLIENKNI